MPRAKVIAIGCPCRGRKWHFEGRVLCFSHWHAAADAHVAAALAKIQSLRAQAMDIGHRMVAGAVWAEDAPAEPSEPRPCDHQNGYCKDTAHKYELPSE